MMNDLLTLFSDPAAWAALVMLIVMEVVLGIDNLLFVAILTNKLPEHQQATGRRIGLILALIPRIALLGAVAYIVQLTTPIFTAFGHGFSWRDLILIGGGLFLVWKATKEIHHNVDPDHGPDLFDRGQQTLSFASAITQIIILNIVFSVDSIITAVGMTNDIPIMVIAVVVSVLVMLVAAGPLGRFIQGNPTIVMLALGFLLMIGVSLIADGFGAHISKGYIYAAMTFSALVEGLNMLSRRARHKREQSASAARMEVDRHTAPVAKA